VKLLLEDNTKTNLVDNDQNTALSKALQRNHDNIARLLLEQPDVDVYFGGGIARQEAVYRGKVDIRKTVLVTPTININVQGGQFGSLVRAAACNDPAEIIFMLLDRGASIDIQGGKYGTPVQAAALWGHVEVLLVLLDPGSDVNTRGARYRLRIASEEQMKSFRIS
jgi:ankyrin repeat protein